MFTLVLLAASVVTQSPILGRWSTEDNQAVVEIAPCGSKLCGTIVRAAPLASTGAPPLDSNNPNPALRKRSRLGVKILNGFVQTGKSWKQGTIYNPVDGKTYKSELKLMSKDKLKVSGCVFVFCQSQIWTKTNK